MASGNQIVSIACPKANHFFQNFASPALMLISTSYPGLLRLLISESNKRRSPGYEVVLIFEISQASFLISCFSLKISCEIKKISWQHAAGLSHALSITPRQ
jgi:hypothetical protein